MTCPSLILHIYVPLAVNTSLAGMLPMPYEPFFTDLVADVETLKQAYPNNA